MIPLNNVAKIMVLGILLLMVGSIPVLCQSPHVKKLSVQSYDISDDGIVLVGTCRVYFNMPTAKTYMNFDNFNAWWEEQEGETISYMGISFKLVSIEWKLLSHNRNYDALQFTAVVAL